ncbi:MAG TPA: SUMF1/EgtB/PvdO family nonheme iron enzyme [Kiritimatiellia bacterium]|nr:SUMF1/EgtB/PvdO family nonheme iron enzyme [Kiritimatiellia bacterium]HOR97839.1 SUMF1/EgtB/PvdO family nonheme iron enzyme [Kiritimatiellia bacterium]HPW75533.1 SUMF1/EgtB/PvdO family nonheme iron enzyme [Kiritimatiellia bacterium]HRU19116.1 SUMF1/EgtB/PvdO family nonheme iron enzyme [Kiritimatiellia bacterium]
MKKSLFALSLFAGLTTLAATITDITVSPRWPWQDKVDIDYTLDSDVYGGFPVTVALYDGETPLTVAAASLPGNGEVRLPGRRHQVFDFALSGLESRPKALRTVITTSANPVRFMIIDLTKRPGDANQREYIYAGDARLESYVDYPIEYRVSDDEAEGMAVTHIDYTDVWFGVTNDNQYARSKMVFRYVPPQAGVKTGDGNVETVFNRVSLTKAYWIAVFPMTQGQYSWLTWDVANRRHRDPNWGMATINETEQQYPMPGGMRDYVGATYTDDPYNDYPAGMRGPVGDPVNPVGWPTYGHDVCPTNLLALYRQKTGLRLDYPTEAQWEVACRAGTTGYYYDKESTAQNTNLLQRIANKIDNNVAVGRYLPNTWGLYDMLGYRGEVMLDRYTSDRISGVDPVGDRDPAKSNYTYARVVRGTSSHAEPHAQATQVGSRIADAAAEWFSSLLTTMRWTVELDD